MALDPSHLPYFLDPEPGGDDLHRSSAPSEDIWKKFELPLPSPPLSPPLPTFGPQDEDYLLDPGSGMGHPRLLDNLSAFILRDCMWSGFSTLERLEKMGASWGQQQQHQDPSSGLGGECVAPGAVFPAGPDSKIPSSSGSESQSDSEGEEIDVVTVEKRQSLGMRKPVTITVRADPLDPCMKRFHISIHQQQHNYAARSPPEVGSHGEALEKDTPEEEEEDEEESNDRNRFPAQVEESFSPEPFLLKSGSAPSSDNEDVTKRKNHNYLERKRRNDLRSRFLALRDQVPDLENCPKTPKVVILSKASEYLQALVSAEERMAAEKKLLKLHQHQLLRRLSHLKGQQ